MKTWRKVCENNCWLCGSSIEYQCNPAVFPGEKCESNMPNLLLCNWELFSLFSVEKRINKTIPDEKHYLQHPEKILSDIYQSIKTNNLHKKLINMTKCTTNILYIVTDTDKTV